MTRDDLKGLLDISSPQIIPYIKELKNKNLIYDGKKKYHLTPLGKMLAKKLYGMIKIFEFIDKNEKFFISHDLSPIPQYLLDRIDELNACMLVENTMTNINATSNEVFKNIAKSRYVRWLCPIFDRSYSNYFLDLANKNISLSIIITRDIYGMIKKDNIDMLRAYLRCNASRLYVIDEARIVLAVSDSFISLSLDSREGKFDTQSALVSSDRSALQWGEELFEFYRENSSEIESVD